MKYTGKWWDNPKRSEEEREVAHWAATTLTVLLVVIGLTFLIL